MSIDEIQKEEKEILKTLVHFLDKNDIKYSIFYGTLLGAVRHNGFIPWDDDIDLVILREDYNKLVSLLKSNNFQINKTGNICAIGFELGNSDWPFIKIVNKDIIIEDKFLCDKNLWIDIFPLDGVPKRNKKMYYSILRRLKDVYLIKRRLKTNISNELLKDKVKNILYYPISYRFIINKIIKFASKYSHSSDTLCNHVWATKQGDALMKSEFHVIDMKFDDLVVKGIENPGNWLSKRYGDDYMELPPVEKRITHSFKARRVKNEK